jgi:hypothetical protein
VQALEVIYARGHGNITAKHRTTFEFTKDIDISARADCIIGVGANKAAADLSLEFKNLARRKDAEITVDIFVEDLHERIKGRGSEKLSLNDARGLIVRRSSYICNRTLMVQADKAAIDLNRALVEKLKLGARIVIQIAVESKS